MSLNHPRIAVAVGGLLVATLASSHGTPACADEAAPAVHAAENSAQGEDAAHGEDAGHTGDEQQRKRRAFTVGIVALLAIAVAGIGLLAFVVVWGARIRRLTRAPLPPATTQRDELWFLRPKKDAMPPDEREEE